MNDRWTTPDRFDIAGAEGVVMVSPFQGIATRDSLTQLCAGRFADAVVGYWPLDQTDDGRFPVVSLLVTSDPTGSFDPELSLREPIEIQVWRDASVTVEVEFVGEQPREVGSRWESLQVAFTLWARARGAELVSLYNDRGRSLSEVWNARFTVPDTTSSLDDLVTLGLRAVAVGELRRDSTAGLDQVLDLLRTGDGHALAGTPLSATLRVMPALPSETPADRLDLAMQTCALANSPTGGMLVLGATTAPRPHGSAAVAGIEAGSLDGVAALVREACQLFIYPPVGGMVIEALPVKSEADGRGIAAVVVPPQDPEAWPFMVHGVPVSGEVDSRFVAIVEPRGADTHVLGVAALHASIAAGRALLR